MSNSTINNNSIYSEFVTDKNVTASFSTDVNDITSPTPLSFHNQGTPYVAFYLASLSWLISSFIIVSILLFLIMRKRNDIISYVRTRRRNRHVSHSTNFPSTSKPFFDKINRSNNDDDTAILLPSLNDDDSDLLSDEIESAQEHFLHSKLNFENQLTSHNQESNQLGISEINLKINECDQQKTRMVLQINESRVNPIIENNMLIDCVPKTTMFEEVDLLHHSIQEKLNKSDKFPSSNRILFLENKNIYI